MPFAGDHSANAGATATGSAIFLEVDEDLRRDRFVSFCRRNRTPMFVIALLVGATLGALKYTDARRIRLAEDANARFRSAETLTREGKKEEAIAAFEALSKSAPKGYVTLARLRLAEEQSASDRDKAVAALDAIADDQNVDALTQDVARLRSAMLLLDGGDREKMMLHFAPLITADGPFRFSAQEAVALDALANEDYDEAERVFDLLLKDKGTPKAVRQRATMYKSLLLAARGPKPETISSGSPEKPAADAGPNPPETAPLPASPPK